MKLHINNLDFFFFVLLFSCLFLLLTFNRGLEFNDEGYILHASQRILQGDVVYKDFHLGYMPFSVWYTAGIFKLVGESIENARVGMIVVNLISTLLIYTITFDLSKKRAVAFLSVLFFLSWGPLHINFSWPVMYAVCFGLSCCYFLLKGITTKNAKWIFISAICMGLVILTKQNFGAAMVVPLLVTLITFRNILRKTDMYRFLGVLFLVGLFFLGVLLLTNSLWAFFNDFYYYSFYTIIIKGVDATPFLKWDTNFTSSLIKNVFYLLPLLISILGISSSIRAKQKKGIVLSTFVLSFYVAGVRPVTDYVHVVPLFSLVALSLSAIYGVIKNKYVQILVIVVLLVLTSLGLYKGLFGGYYKWETPINKDVYFLENPRVRVWADGKYDVTIQQLTNYRQKYIRKNDYVFINYFAPSLYFILNPQNPTKFIYLSENVLRGQYEEDIIHDLQHKKVKWIITHVYFNNDSSSNLAKYIYNHYTKTTVLSDYQIWKTK